MPGLSLLISALIDGVSHAMTLFLISSGLVIIFGLMDVFNLAHATFFALGAYLFLQFYLSTSCFLISLAIPIAVGILIGLFVERVLIRPLYGRHIMQLLLTMGLMLLLLQIIQIAWPAGLYFPETENRILSGMLEIAGTRVRIYKFVLVCVGLLVYLVIDLFMGRTRFGAMLRAGTENRELARAFGINIELLFTASFAFGSALAFMGGALISPLVHATIELPTTFTLMAFVVPVVGGMRSYKGAFYASLLIGVIDRLVAYYFSWLSFAIDLIIMIVVLLIKPEGLFGGE
ncbi:MAG TPA: branched-chain amino acid ABC transporter permease [Candidatus Bathyarchaeota archaeon]|nr:branched-chain amino acid ABC transporter permease [Candidatus Bathyarchaeota archaeon]